LVKERIICEYLSGSKTVQMLSEEYGVSRNAINHMVSRHKSKFSPTFEAKPIYGMSESPQVPHLLPSNV
ncbi:hypothetical protein EZS27_044427, partial [termite gut metagenome]